MPKPPPSKGGGSKSSSSQKITSANIMGGGKTLPPQTWIQAVNAQNISNKMKEANRINAVAQATRIQRVAETNKKLANLNKDKYKKTIGYGTDPGVGSGDQIVPPDFTPYSPEVGEVNTPPLSIKIPNKDNILSFDKANYNVAEITALVFEKLGAVELTKFTRTDTVDGINPYYNIISNLSSIKKEFDPSNLISSQKSDTSLYNAFSIKLENKIPGEKYLEDRSLENYIYIDTSGNLVIELINITSDELVEVEIDTNGTIVEVRDA